MESKKQRRAERERRCPGEVSALLSMDQQAILAVMDRHGVDAISLEDVREWEANPATAPEVFTALGKRREELRERRALREEEHRVRRELEREALAAFPDPLTGKIRLGMKLSSKEAWALEVAAFDLAKDIVGMNPAEVMAMYKDNEFAQAVAYHSHINLLNHETYPAHLGGCDFQGRDVGCRDRIEEFEGDRGALLGEERERRREVAREKAEVVSSKGIQVGDVVLCSWDKHLGRVVKVNKVSYTIRVMGKGEEKGKLVEARFHPTYVTRVNVDDYPRPTV